MTGGAGEFVKVHKRDAGVFRDRRTETAGGVASFTGGSGSQWVCRVGGFVLVSSDYVVRQAVAVTIDAGQSGGEVDIFIFQPLFGAVVVHVNVGVTEIAPFGRDFSNDVKEYLVLVVKRALGISDRRRDFLFVFRGLGHKGVVSVGHISGGAADGSESTSGSVGPAEVLTGYL